MTQPLVEAEDLLKRYDGVVALDGLSFQVHAGEVFGLLGPNGAGKTTAIRILMDILRPDAGSVRVLGGPPAAARSRVGYLPEERGLYPDRKVLQVLVYLARLKGTSADLARARALGWLERVGLAERAGDKVRDLSRGMQQKVQFIASLLHDPDLLILDEPFQGLDPVNVDLVKRLIRELQAAGKTIVLSTHQMNLVEVLCDRILLVDHGRAVLYGDLEEVRRRYAPSAVRLRTPAPVDAASLPGVARVERRDHDLLLTLEDGSPEAVLRTLLDRGVPIEAFEVAAAPLEAIFVAVVRGEAGHG